MARGFKRDETATSLAQQGFTSPMLYDSRSFVSLPVDGKAHLVLYGVDVVEARKRAVERATGYDGLMRCQCGCNMTITDDVHEMSPIRANMHHLNNRQRCCCDHNLAMFSRMCHAHAHPDRRLG